MTRRSGDVLGRCEGQRADGDVVALDRHEPADRDEQGLAGAQADLRPERGAVLRSGSGERIEVETEPQHAHAPVVADPEAPQIGHRGVAHADQDIAGPAERAFCDAVERRHEPSEVALEDVAVVGVDDDRPGSDDECGEAAEQPCLGGVSVHEIGPHSAHEAHELGERPQVAQRSDLAPEVGELAARRRVADVEVRELRFPGPDPSMDQQGLVALAQARGEEADVVGRPAGVEPGDDPDSTRTRRSLRVTRPPPEWAGARRPRGSGGAPRGGRPAARSRARRARARCRRGSAGRRRPARHGDPATTPLPVSSRTWPSSWLRLTRSPQAML